MYFWSRFTCDPQRHIVSAAGCSKTPCAASRGSLEVFSEKFLTAIAKMQRIGGCQKPVYIPPWQTWGYFDERLLKKKERDDNAQPGSHQSRRCTESDVFLWRKKNIEFGCC
jgi:hypothetical protein